MARTIPCDTCEQYPAMFLVTFLPAAEVVGLGLECVPSWVEAMAQVYDLAEAGSFDPDATHFRVTAIPTGDEEELTWTDLKEWAETLVRAMDAMRAAEAAGPDVEPITRPGPSKGRKRAQKGRGGDSGAAPAATDDEWEASGLAGRPALPPDGGPEVGGGQEVGETPPQAASDGR